MTGQPDEALKFIAPGSRVLAVVSDRTRDDNTPALFPMAAGPQSTTFAEWLYGLYKDGLRRLENGTGIPADAIMTGAGALPRSFATSHPDSVSADVDGTPGNTIDPVFRRDTRW